MLWNDNYYFQKESFAGLNLAFLKWHWSDCGDHWHFIRVYIQAFEQGWKVLENVVLIPYMFCFFQKYIFGVPNFVNTVYMADVCYLA